MLIEHHLDLIKSADWIIDLGPGAGDAGGYIVAEGTPEQLAGMEHSHTGQYLKTHLKIGEPAKAKAMQASPPS